MKETEMEHKLLEAEQKKLIEAIEQKCLSSHEQEMVFCEFAQAFLNKVEFEKEKTICKPIDIEIYYHSDRHPDPYVYKHKEQLDYGVFHPHGSGVDVVFGDEEQEIYFGVLICGIESEGGTIDKKFKIYEKLGNGVSVEVSKSTTLIEEDKQQPCSVYRSTRVNLNYNPLDSSQSLYIGRRYRFASKMPSAGKVNFSIYYWLDCLNGIRTDCPKDGIEKTHKFFQQYCKQNNCSEKQIEMLKKWGIKAIK
jgi:hypothetical protein